MKILVFTGFEGCGKTTAASYAESRYYHLRSIHAQLRDGTAALFGLTPAQMDDEFEHRQPIPELGDEEVTPEYLQAWLGKQVQARFGRAIFLQNMLRQAQRAGEDKIVIDDAVHPDDLHYLRGVGARIIGIRRPRVQPYSPVEKQLERVWDDITSVTVENPAPLGATARGYYQQVLEQVLPHLD